MMKLLKKVMVPYESLDSAFKTDRCIFQVYRFIYLFLNCTEITCVRRGLAACMMSEEET